MSDSCSVLPTSLNCPAAVRLWLISKHLECKKLALRASFAEHDVEDGSIIVIGISYRVGRWVKCENKWEEDEEESEGEEVFSYVEMLPRYLSFTKWFDHAREQWHTQAYYDDRMKIVTYPRQLPEADLKSFLCNIFDVPVRPGDGFAIYYEFDASPVTTMTRSGSPKFIWFHCLPHATCNFIRTCCHVIFTCSQDGMVNSRTFAALFSRNATVRHVKAYAVELDLLPAEVPLQAFQTDDLGIYTLLSDGTCVTKIRFLVRIEVARENPFDDELIVACPSLQVSYVERVESGDTFAILKKRVQDTLATANESWGKIVEDATCEFVSKGPVREVIHPSDDDDVIDDIDLDHHRLIIRPPSDEENS
jgi:hypothetical protein